jgi:hypothetical protein
MPFGVPDFHALHIEQGQHYFVRNDFHTALVEFEQALQLKETAMARYNRAHALLAMGNYAEAWPDYAARYALFKDTLAFTPAGHKLRQRVPIWRGQHARRIALLSEGGFGDTIMLLRFVPLCEHVVMEVPSCLKTLAGQVGPLYDGDADYWCSMFDLPGIFDPHIPAPPYLTPDPALASKWEAKISNGDALRIGIVWSSNTSHFGEHDLQTRSLELAEFLILLPMEGSLYSLQQHDRLEAERHGVHTPDLKDFNDVAALASLMDVIVSVDTAALHVAGAIGHPTVFAILPWASTWRWQDKRWYPHMNLCKAIEPNDWASAFAQIRRVT